MAALINKFEEEKVHALYPEASMLPPMLMWSLPSNKEQNLQEYCESGDYLASVKKDGYFYMLNKTPNHTYLFSRSPSVKTKLLTEKSANVPHLAEVAEALPADTILMGEIYIPGQTSSGVTRIMGSLPKKAIDRQEKEGYVYYYLFDVVMYDGQSLLETPFEERYKILQEIYNTYFVNIPFVEYAEQVDTNIYETIFQWIAEGEEGAVLRRKDFTYQPGKRPAWSSIKVKQETTIDVILTGFEDPTKEYKGKELDTWQYWVMEKDINMMSYPHQPSQWVEKEKWVGDPKAIRSPEFRTIPVTKAYYYGWKNRIYISAYNSNGELEEIGTISSGLTDELRQAFAENPEKYINRVIEIKCMSVDKKEHSIRHGFFLRFRDDKNPSDCLISEIFR